MRERERAHESSDVPWSTRERERREHEGSTAFSRRCTAAANARETQGLRSQEASHEVATEFRVETPAYKE